MISLLYHHISNGKCIYLRFQKCISFMNKIFMSILFSNTKLIVHEHKVTFVLFKMILLAYYTQTKHICLSRYSFSYFNFIYIYWKHFLWEMWVYYFTEYQIYIRICMASLLLNVTPLSFIFLLNRERESLKWYNLSFNQFHINYLIFFPFK